MNRKVWFILAFVGCSLSLSAQKIYNYGGHGRRIKTAAEFVDISLEHTPSEGVTGTESVIAGILLGPVYNIISSTIKEQLKRREKKFIGTYANSSAFPYNIFDPEDKKNLTVRRYAINTMAEINPDHLMAEYALPVTVDDQNITFKLKSILLNRTKAKYRSGDKLSISIHIAAKDINRNGRSIGEGTIVVPVFKITGKKQDMEPYEENINKIVLPNPGVEQPGNIQLSITVTETNISRLKPDRIQELISNNSEDIRTILKTILGL